jgi:hypothetical protein
MGEEEGRAEFERAPHDCPSTPPRCGSRRRRSHGSAAAVFELNASTGAHVQVLSAWSYGFDDPDAITTNGTHVWVANEDGMSVTELSASTGALVKVISAPGYGFDLPDAIASDATTSGWRTRATLASPSHSARSPS